MFLTSIAILIKRLKRTVICRSVFDEEKNSILRSDKCLGLHESRLQMYLDIYNRFSSRLPFMYKNVYQRNFLTPNLLRNWEEVNCSWTKSIWPWAKEVAASFWGSRILLNMTSDVGRGGSCGQTLRVAMATPLMVVTGVPGAHMDYTASVLSTTRSFYVSCQDSWHFLFRRDTISDGTFVCETRTLSGANIPIAMATVRANATWWRHKAKYNRVLVSAIIMCPVRISALSDLPDIYRESHGHKIGWKAAEDYCRRCICVRSRINIHACY